MGEQAEEEKRVAIFMMDQEFRERGSPMKKACWVVVSLFIIACFNSCAVIGRSKDFRPFDESTLKKVTPGKTTANEVTELFGAPSQVVKLSNGNAYVYARSLSKATGLWLVILTFANFDTQHDRIVFFINKDDVVTHYGSSFKTESASYEMPL